MLDLDFFARIHEALVRLMRMPPDLSLDILYALHRTYIITMRQHYARDVPKLTRQGFQDAIQQSDPRYPDHNFLTLYRAMEHLLEDIDLGVLDQDQANMYLIACQTHFFIKLRYEAASGVCMEDMQNLIDRLVSSLIAPSSG